MSDFTSSSGSAPLGNGYGPQDQWMGNQGGYVDPVQQPTGLSSDLSGSSAWMQTPSQWNQQASSQQSPDTPSNQGISGSVPAGPDYYQQPMFVPSPPQDTSYQQSYEYVPQPQSGFQPPYPPAPYQQPDSRTPMAKSTKALLIALVVVGLVAMTYFGYVIASHAGNSSTQPPVSGPTQTSEPPIGGPSQPVPTQGTNNNPNSISWDDLLAGDCFQSGDESSGAQKIDVVSCSTPHDAEAFYVMDLSIGTSTYPGEDFIQQNGNLICPPVFITYVYSSPEESSLRVRFIYPDEQAWDDGAHVLVCFAQASTPTLTTTVEHSGI